MADESIYNLIPVPPEEIVKPPIYRSKHNPTLMPSYSTIGLTNTSKLVTNTGGVTDGPDADARNNGRKTHATMGNVVAGNVNPKQFLKKSGSPEVNKHTFSRSASEPRKAPVPPKDERPIMGLRSEKNFVVANSVENIISVPKKKHVPPLAATARHDYGKAPKYLRNIKQALESEKTFIKQSQELQDQQPMPQYMREIDEFEKREMVVALKEKFEEKQKLYYALPFSKDTATQVARKEHLEKEMAAIEAALKKIDKEVVLVYSDMNKHYSMYARGATLKEAQKLATTRSTNAPSQN
jgi:hypothetical protein